MYESYFGLNGSPFQLNPDPGFYFDSRGHNSALSYLKFGLYQAEGFIVITGDIGAGKTTLVRTLLSDIDTDKVVAAQLVSTQLEAGDLLRSAITAFGIPPTGQSKADLIATLEAFLTMLATQNKRAVLIVDEAQNLSRDAIEELRMLSNFQFGHQALLQSFLIGQPELRDMLLSRSLEQLRQRVIASYHLGPMDRDETRRYIEHRLRKVGWTDRPHFEADAFDEIYQWTSGIPRRINLLCNRLLLATYLAEGQDITALDVTRVAMEMRAEIGEAILTQPVSRTHIEPTASPLPDAQTATLTEGVASPTAPIAEARSTGIQRNTAHTGQTPHLLLIAGSLADCTRAAALQAVCRTRADLPELRWLVLDAPGRFGLSNAWSEHLGLRAPDIHLTLSAGTPLAQMADALRLLEQALSEAPPSALIVQSGEDAALAACLVAQRLDIPVIHLEAGLRSFDRGNPHEANAMMCDHLADLMLTSEWMAHDNLMREGIPADRVQFVGNVLMDTIRTLLPLASPAKYTLRQYDQPDTLARHPHGYGVVYLRGQNLSAHPAGLAELVRTLLSVSRDIPLLWPMSEHTRQALEHHHLLADIDAQQIALLPIIPYVKMIGLLESARCVLTDSSTVQEESTILGVPCLTLDNYTDRRITVEQGTNIVVGLNSNLTHRAVAEILRGGGKKGRLPKFWDGTTASRVAEHLAHWWRQRSHTRPPEAA